MLEVGGIRSGGRKPETVLCFLAAWAAVGLLARLAVPAGHSIALIWPSAGVAVLWFMVTRATWRTLDPLLLAAAAFATNTATGSGVGEGMVLAAANVAQTLLAVELLRRWRPDLWGVGGDRGLDSGRTAALGFAAIASGMALGAAIGTVGALVLSHPVALSTWPAWFARNLAGALVVVPLGLLLGRHLTSARPRPPLFGSTAAGVEYAAALVFTAALYALGLGLEALPLAFALPVATVWVGIRFRPVATALHASLAGIGTVAVTLLGFGQFAAIEDPWVQASLAQAFVITVVFLGLALATRREENRLLADGLREAERTARFQSALLDSVVTSMTEGVAVVDAHDRILMRNPAADRLGYVDSRRSEDEHPGFEVFHPDGTPVPPQDRPSQRALRGELVEDEEVVLSPDSQGRVLSVSAIPLAAPADPEPVALLMFRDYTEAYTRRAELDTFAGTVAHDLRNPLSAIEGWTEMLEDEVVAGEIDPAMVTSFIHQLRLATGRMHSLIADLLDHATSGNRRLEMEKVDLHEVVTELAEARGATDLISVEDLPWIRADRVLVSQVFDNLVGNALKYVAPGVRPEVVVSVAPAAAGWARIRVTDNGIGLPPGEQERIFQEFHRAHGAQYEGTGLGLAIVRRIVVRHGGTITARNRDDGVTGSVFEVTLPAYG